MWQAKIIVGFAAVSNLTFLVFVVWLAFSGQTLSATPEHPVGADTALLCTALFGVNSWLAITYLFDLWERDQ